MHEVFEAPAGSWESSYSNIQPAMLSDTRYLRKGDKTIGGTLDDCWVSPVVNIGRDNMRTYYGRIGWTGKISEVDILGRNVYTIL